jgi:hypothetical protein
LVTYDIAGKFGFPVCTIVAGHTTVPAAAMPEATVHEHSYVDAGEDEVGATGERLVATPAGYAGGAKDGDQL